MLIYKHIFFLADAERALRLLEQYHSKLTNPKDAALRNALERVIKIFRSRLFYALIGKQCFVQAWIDGNHL